MRVGAESVQVRVPTELPLPKASTGSSGGVKGNGQPIDFGPPTSSPYTSTAQTSLPRATARLPDTAPAGELLEALMALFQGKAVQGKPEQTQDPQMLEVSRLTARAPVSSAEETYHAAIQAVENTQAVEKKTVEKTPAEKSVNKTDPAVLARLDESEFSGPEQLEKWDDLVSHLPPEQREAAARELNRPYAAAKMALEGGQGAQDAMTYLMANPALRAAVDTGAGGSRHNVRADGKITDNDLKGFAGNLEKRAREAGTMVEDYRQENPDADPQSLSMVRSAALMYANDPILKAASSSKAVGTDGQHNTRYAEKSDLKALADPSSNPGLSPLLGEASRLWGKPGMFDILEDAGLRGKDVARHGGDGLLDKGDFGSFITRLAPRNGAEFSDFMSYAAMMNAAGKVDISNLDGDVFDHPEQYTGAARFAVMMKLQKTQQYVMAGREIRKTEHTEEELQGKIDKLQNDPDVQRFMEEQIKANKREIIQSSPELAGNVERYLQTEVITGNALKDSLTPKDGKPGADQVTEALDDFRDEVQQYQELTGSALDVADIVASRPDLANAIQRVVPEVYSGEHLTQLAQQKDVSPEQALDGYWKSVAFIDDALSRVPGGSPGLPKREVVENALENAGVDPRSMANIEDTTLQGLLKNSDSHLANPHDQQAGRGNELLGDLKDKMIKKAAKQAARQGGKFATQMVANLAGRAVGAAVGEAAGLAAASTISSAAGPVGWVAGAAVSLGFGIAELVNHFKGKEKRRNERRDFDHTVSPTLKQFEIARPK